MNEKEIKNYIDGNSLEFKHFKLYADSTLKNMTKDELISYIHVIYHNWKCADIEKERLHKIICDLTNNQPYKFEELKAGMWVWDDRLKACFLIKEIRPKTNWNIVIYANYLTDTLEELEFKENRFFPLTKKDMEVKK